MKRTSLLLIVLYLTLGFLISTPSFAFLSSDVKKVKEFMAAGMYPQATYILFGNTDYSDT